MFVVGSRSVRFSTHVPSKAIAALATILSRESGSTLVARAGAAAASAKSMSRCARCRFMIEPSGDGIYYEAAPMPEAPPEAMRVAPGGLQMEAGLGLAGDRRLGGRGDP